MMSLAGFGKNRGRLLNWCKYTKQKLLKRPRYLLTQRVRAYLNDISENEELHNIRKFLKCNLVEVFNDPLVYDYNFRKIKVCWDTNCSLWYVNTFGNKRLYFKKGLDKKQVRCIYNGLCKEQDVRSPHYYFFDSLRLSENSVVADIGVAEGNFALEIVEHVKELYLFECDEAWIEALHATFAPWKEKVHIIHSFISDKTSENTIRLDDFFLHRQAPDLLKIDVEGAEEQVLNGAMNLLQQRKMAELLVCTYHKQDDARVLSEKLMKTGYSIRFSKGYMLFLTEGYSAQPPYDFRKGLLHAFEN